MTEAEADYVVPKADANSVVASMSSELWDVDQLIVPLNYLNSPKFSAYLCNGRLVVYENAYENLYCVSAWVCIHSTSNTANLRYTLMMNNEYRKTACVNQPLNWSGVLRRTDILCLRLHSHGKCGNIKLEAFLKVEKAYREIPLSVVIQAERNHFKAVWGEVSRYLPTQLFMLVHEYLEQNLLIDTMQQPVLFDTRNKNIMYRHIVKYTLS